jgi:thiopeptide-type bacteriocin biosynthesis protein
MRENKVSRAVRKPIFRPLDWLMVRTPLLPVEEYLALAGKPDLSWPVRTVAGTALPADPRIHRALAVGATDLVRALEKPPTSEAARRRLAGKLLRYLIRMSTRPTPFGAFAGVGLASWQERTDLALAADPPRTRTRPDMGWLLDFVATLEKRADIREGLGWYANPSAFVRADRVFLTERATIGDPAEASRAVNLRATGAVQKVLEFARTPVKYEELIGALMAGGAPRAKVEPFVEQLWEQTLLLTDLRPPLTIAEPARYVADRLAAIPAAAAEAAALADLLDEIADWDTLPVSQAASGYVALATKVQSTHQAEVKDGRSVRGPLQTDLALSLDSGGVNAAVGAEVAALAETLLRLTPRPRGVPYLDKYRLEFETRYGSDREVPLLELLDPKLGLGAPDQHYRDAKETPSDKQSERERTLIDLALNAIKDGRHIVELDEATINKLQLEPLSVEDLQPSLDVSVFLMAKSAAAVDSGDFQIVIGPNTGASGAGRVLGRFADLIGPSAQAALQATADAESARGKGKLRAEVTYLPRTSRLANVTVRPLVRDLELPIGTTPGVPADRVLPVDELVVGIRGGRFVISWPAGGQEIVPCAGHMLNTAVAPTVIRFLDEVTRDRRTLFSSFDWGPATRFPFLPRVQLGRIVLAPARWEVPADAVDNSSAEVFASSFGKWRERWQPPRYSYLVIADNRLLLDLDEPDHLEQLRAESRKSGGDHRPLTLHEALPAPDHAWVSGPDGNYLSELVVPLIVDSDEKASEPVIAKPTMPTAQSRLRPPGSDWLFAKVYFLPPYEEDLLVGPIRTLTSEVLGAGYADSWFFMRYEDPDPHVRVRWHGDPATLNTKLAPVLLTWGAELVRDGYVQRFCLDTYDQEVERYGGPAGMELAERLFAADSTAVVDLLQLVDSRKLDIERAQLGVYTVDMLLSALGLDLAERTHLYAGGLRDRKETSEEFRQEQSAFRSVLGDPDWLSGQPAGAEAAAILAVRNRAVRAVGAELDLLADIGQLGKAKQHLARSFVHMHCNRLLGCGHPPEQRVLGLALRTRESLARAPWRPRAT